MIKPNIAGSGENKNILGNEENKNIMYDNYYLEEKNVEQLLNIYFEKIYKYFGNALKSYKIGKGFGIGKVCCGFAKGRKPKDSDYFGKTGVAFWFDKPIVEKDTIVIIRYEEFYNRIKDIAKTYIEDNPTKKEGVEQDLEAIKNYFEI